MYGSIPMFLKKYHQQATLYQLKVNNPVERIILTWL